MKNNNLIIAAVIALVVGGGAGFFGGMKYQQSQTTAARAAGGPGAAGLAGRGTGARGTGAAGGSAMRPVVGQILSQDATSITVKLADGSSKIVLLPSSATYSKTSTGAKTDLKVGDQVGVFGATNSDGSVTAQSVQENPNFGMMRGPGVTPTATPAATPGK